MSDPRIGMHFPTSILLISASLALSAVAAPPFALVKVQEIYSELPSTTALQEQIKQERNQIMADQRAEKLRKIVAELQAIQSQLSDKVKPLGEAEARDLARSYELKRQEALTLQKDFENFQADEEKKINLKMVAAMRTSLDRIAEVTRMIAKERGFATVLDSSGNSNTGVPFVLFSKDAPDITADVHAAMKDRDPGARAAGKSAKPRK